MRLRQEHNFRMLLQMFFGELPTFFNGSPPPTPYSVITPPVRLHPCRLLKMDDINTCIGQFWNVLVHPHWENVW